MADSDEDYSSDNSVDDDNSTDALDNGSNEGDGEKAPRNSTRNTRNPATKRKAGLPSTLRALIPMKKHLTNSLKGQDIDGNMSLRVCKAVLEMQESYLRAKQKASSKKGGMPKRPAIKGTVTKLFGIGNDQYTQITKKYFETRQSYSTGKTGTGRTGNQTPKATRIARTLEVSLRVQKYIRDKRASRERVTARQLVDFLVGERFLAIPVDESGRFQSRAFETAYRNVRRFVESLGYERGRRTGNLVQKESVILHRQNFLKAFFENRARPPEDRLREVYMDESYIHHHYHRFDDSLWDPNDEQDLQVSKAPVKGRRYCFAAAIQGPDPRVCITQNSSKETLAGLVPGSVWDFCPQAPGASKGDYHKVFHGKNFLAWWKNQLLPNLKQPSLIMLDNAKYHLGYDESVPPVTKMKKNELIAYLESQSVHLEGHYGVVQLRNMAREWIKKNEKIAIVKAAEEAGHKVLLTPPYHSDLQPIELVWALIKGNVGRMYAQGDSLQTVHKRLKEEFTKLEKEGHESVGKMIEKCARKGEELYQEELVSAEPANTDEEDSEGDTEDEGDDGMFDEDVENDVFGDMVQV
jgi:transposase